MRAMSSLKDSEKLELQRLADNVANMAAKLELLIRSQSKTAIGGVDVSSSSAFQFGTSDEGRMSRNTRPPLPDPRLLRKIIRHRQARVRYFRDEIFADPAWDILLDLAAARVEHKRVSVTSLCIAAGVPATTALRWIGLLTEEGLLKRVEDDTDRRRAFVALTDRAADSVARYFQAIGDDLKYLV
jgi:predicted transcriptional regulator